MRKAVLAAALLLLSGCTSFTYMTSDAFDPGSATMTRFTLDDAGCRDDALVQRDATVLGIAGTHMEQHEIYNRTYAACMRQHGYAERDWSPEIGVPYHL